MSTELISEQRGRVLILTISNPEARNALGPDVFKAGREALERASQDNSIGTVVVTGAGEHFCAGGNLKRLQANQSKPREVQAQSVGGMHALIHAVRETPKPVIAAVEGAAAGAGFSLALACDLLVAAESAYFVMAYIKVGLNPDGGASTLLTRGVPPQLAAELMFGGDKIEAARLHALGVVNRLVAKGHALDAATEWAEKLAAGPSAALGRAKNLIETAYSEHIHEHLEREAEYIVEAVHHPESKEGIAAFLEKRKPDFHR